MKALTYPDTYGPWSAEWWIKSKQWCTGPLVWQGKRMLRNSLVLSRRLREYDKAFKVGDTVTVRVPPRFSDAREV